MANTPTEFRRAGRRTNWWKIMIINEIITIITTLCTNRLNPRVRCLCPNPRLCHHRCHRHNHCPHISSLCSKDRTKWIRGWVHQRLPQSVQWWFHPFLWVISSALLSLDWRSDLLRKRFPIIWSIDIGINETFAEQILILFKQKQI